MRIEKDGMVKVIDVTVEILWYIGHMMVVISGIWLFMH